MGSPEHPGPDTEGSRSSGEQLLARDVLAREGEHRPRIAVIIETEQGWRVACVDLELTDLDRTPEEIVERFIVPAGLYAVTQHLKRLNASDAPPQAKTRQF